MKCPDNGVIQTYIDGELEIDVKKELENHFTECSKCAANLEELKANDDFVFTRIKGYKKYMNTKATTKAEPFNSNTNNTNNISEDHEYFDTRDTQKGVYKIMIKYKKYVAVACAAVVVTTCMAYQPVRAAISNSLLIFRADNVKSLKISTDDIKNIQTKLSKNEAEIDMDKLGKIKTTGGERKEITIDEAKSISDFKVTFPSEIYGTKPQIATNLESSMEFTLNVDYINKALKSLGAKTLLPKEVDGKTFQVNIPRQVTMNYNLGDQKHFSIIQSKIPEINAPEGVNSDDIYNALVDMPIIPDNLKTQLKAIKDWKSTLYIPVVDSQMQEISVNGVKGYILSNNNSSSDKSNSYTNIVWYSNDTIYAINGNLVKDEILNIANSMR